MNRPFTLLCDIWHVVVLCMEVITMATINKFMIPIYGRLVLAGTWTVDPDDTTRKQVPKRYVDAVCEWLAEYEAKKGD